MLKNFVKRAAAVAAALSTAVMLSVGYYGKAIPDSFNVEAGKALELDTSLYITAEKTDKAKEAVSIKADSEKLTLKLFGSIPIKEVKKNVMERPRLLAGGQAFGIKLITDGVMIIDMKKLSGSCPALEAGLRIGDIIESVNGQTVGTNARLSEIIRDSQGEDCTIVYRRDEMRRVCSVRPVLNEGSYRAGMWVRDSSAGIGTLTFIDPENGIFAGLGHSICDSDTHEPLPLSQGTISNVKIDSISKSSRGTPGQIVGEFDGEDVGTLFLNCPGGVYGELDELPENAVSYPLGFSYEVHEGAAYMITQVDGGEPRRFNITIDRISPADCEHDLIIHTTDPELIEAAGGIVQGMSGSPIIQDGRLVGAVTHVFVDDPCGGYGIFAEKMYQYAAGCTEDSDQPKAG